MAGVRIIAYYHKDVEAICRLIERNFAIDSDNSVDKDAALAPDKFGYLSKHYVVSHNDERKKLPENAAFAGLKAETQVRTVLQHAWAALDRKLRYNSEEDIPREIRRKLFRVSALLESADDNFSEIDRIVGNLRVQYTSDIKVGNLDQEINLDSLEVFMREAESVRTLEIEAKKHYKIAAVDQSSLSDAAILKSVSNLVMSAHVAGIKTIKQLNEAVLEFNKIAKETFLHLVEQSKDETFTSAGVIRLGLVYVTRSETSAQILRLVPFYGKLQKILAKTLHPNLKLEDGDRVLSEEVFRRMLTANQFINPVAFSVERQARTKPKKLKRRAKRKLASMRRVLHKKA